MCSRQVCFDGSGTVTETINDIVYQLYVDYTLFVQSEARAHAFYRAFGLFTWNGFSPLFCARWAHAPINNTHFLLRGLTRRRTSPLVIRIKPSTPESSSALFQRPATAIFFLRRNHSIRGHRRRGHCRFHHRAPSHHNPAHMCLCSMSAS